ncbi:hypothetical protein Riv7116_6808 [Rivularia sp. PCC 7116]|nr:hypothetical protein Riv7116_6808 [Rivularia sp. PCC 7116]
MFFWDLNSYSSEDKSYDIYAMSHEDYESCKIERDFYIFIYNYCLGMKKYENIPDTFILDDEEIAWVFSY